MTICKDELLSMMDEEELKVAFLQSLSCVHGGDLCVCICKVSDTE